MQIRCYCELYVSEALKKRKNKMINKIMNRELRSPIFVISLAQGKQNHLEIFSSLLLRQHVYDDELVFMVGIAENYGAALGLVEKIVQDVLDETGGTDIRSYIKNKQQCFQESRG